MYVTVAIQPVVNLQLRTRVVTCRAVPPGVTRNKINTDLFLPQSNWL